MLHLQGRPERVGFLLSRKFVLSCQRYEGPTRLPMLRLQGWVILPNWPNLPMPSQFVLPCQHHHSHRLPCALDVGRKLHRPNGLPVRRRVRVGRRGVQAVRLWHLQREGHGGRMQRVSREQQHIGKRDTLAFTVSLSCRICWRFGRIQRKFNSRSGTIIA
jgi:hypothetical protein